jgi:hypothetical protein
MFKSTLNENDSIYECVEAYKSVIKFNNSTESDELEFTQRIKFNDFFLVNLNKEKEVQMKNNFDSLDTTTNNKNDYFECDLTTSKFNNITSVSQENLLNKRSCPFDTGKYN